MTERGTVVRVTGERAGVRLGGVACASCGGCSGQQREHIVLAQNRTAGALREGDEVEITVPTGEAVLSGFLVLVLPLLLFVPFYFLPQVLGLTVREEIRVLCGIGGVAIGFLLNLLAPWRKKAQALPEIVRRIDRDAPQTVHGDP